MNYTNVVLSFVQLLSLNLLMTMLEESITTQLVIFILCMKSQLWVGEKKTALSSGTSEILGELTGEKMGSSELLEVLITSL